MKAYALLRESGPKAALGVLDGIRSTDAIVLKTTYTMRAILLVHAGRLAEAKAEIARLRELDPTWTLKKHRKRHFYVDPSLLEGSLKALAAAGLPEN